MKLGDSPALLWILAACARGVDSGPADETTVGPVEAISPVDAAAGADRAGVRPVADASLDRAADAPRADAASDDAPEIDAAGDGDDGGAPLDAGGEAGPPPPPPCGGASLAGYCWYAAAAGASCDAACAALGGCNQTGTVAYAGSGGTDAQCVAVLGALGFGVYPHQNWSSNDLGCHFAWGSYTYWSTALPTTCASANGVAQRMCACNQ